MKYSPTLAILVSRSIFNGENSLGGISRLYGLDPKEVVVWSALYRTYGEDVFRTSQDYSQNLREHIVQDKLKNGLSLTEICVKYKILHRSSLRNWIHLYKTKQMVTGRKSRKTSSVPAAPEAKDRIRELEEELFFVKAENAYLKKLRALMQKTKKSGYSSK